MGVPGIERYLGFLFSLERINMKQQKSPFFYIGIASVLVGLIMMSLNQSEEVVVTHIVNDS